MAVVQYFWILSLFRVFLIVQFVNKLENDVKLKSEPAGHLSSVAIAISKRRGLQNKEKFVSFVMQSELLVTFFLFSEAFVDFDVITRWQVSSKCQNREI